MIQGYDFPQFYLGVDPGYSGAVVALTHAGTVHSFIKFKETEADIAAFFKQFYEVKRVFAYLEQVHSMPNQGVSSTFKFGTQYGFCRGMLISNKISFETITPNKWQTIMKCKTGGNKNISKAKAQELFPKVNMTHAIADSMLIAECCRRSSINN